MSKLMVALLCIALAACATPQVLLESSIDTGALSEQRLVLLETAVIDVRNAAKVRLKQGTTWRHIGTIDNGMVYRTRDQVVVVNSFDVFEAAIVLSGDQLVGFYLPIEESYVEAKQATKLQLSTE